MSISNQQENFQKVCLVQYIAKSQSIEGWDNGVVKPFGMTKTLQGDTSVTSAGLIQLIIKV